MEYNYIKLRNLDNYFDLSVVCDTPEQAQAVVALFPKYCKLHVCRLHTYDSTGIKTRVYHMATVEIDLRPNKSTGQVNETGIKRRDKIVEVLTTNNLTATTN